MLKVMNKYTRFADMPRPDLKLYGQLVAIGLYPEFDERDKRAGRITPDKPPHNEVKYRSASGKTVARVLSGFQRDTMVSYWELWFTGTDGKSKKVFTCNAYDPEAVAKIKQTLEIYEP